MKNLWRIACVIYLAVLAAPAHAVVSEATIIKGFAEWQASRIEDITLQLGLIQISNNTHVNAIFPSTRTAILTDRDFMGPALATVVERAMKRDLDMMKYITGQCLPTLLNDSSQKLAGQFEGDGTLKDDYDQNILNAAIDDLKRIYQGFQAIGGSKSIEFAEVSGDQKTKGRIEDTWDFDDKICYLTDYKGSGWNPVKLNSDDVLKYLGALKNWDKLGDFVEDDNFKEFITDNRLGRMVTYLIKTYIIVSNVKDLENYSVANTKKRIGPAKGAAANVSKEVEIKKDLVTTYNENVEKIGYAVQVRDLMYIMDTYIGFGGNNYPGFLELKRASLFLAYLADASNAGSKEVALVLRQYVDGKNAYKDKREPTGYWARFTRYVPNDDGIKPVAKNYTATCSSRYITCRKTLFLSSFWGAALSYDKGDAPISDSQSKFRAFGPVGLEWKLATVNGRALSVNYAPIDIGAYVQNELTDSEYSASFSDISSPSAFVSWSLKNYPIAVLAGYQWDLKSERGEEDSIFLALTFDLPILTLR